MSKFSERVHSQRTGLFKVADLEGGKELTLTISELLEEQRMFDKDVDLFCFEETGKQLQLNQTVSEWLIDNLGTEPDLWKGQQVTLYLDTYEYNKERRLGVRIKLAGDNTSTPHALDQPKAGGKGNGDDPDDAIPF